MDERDATPVYASWLNDEEVNRYLATKSATVDELVKYIALKNEQKDTELYGIYLREGDRHIGTMKLEPIDRTAKKATIAIMIGDKREWGKGLAGEAMQLLIRRCFETLGIEEIHLGVVGANAAAIRAYEKLGFKEVSRKQGAVVYPNGTFDQIEMTLIQHA